MGTSAPAEYRVHMAYKVAVSSIDTVGGGHNGIVSRMPGAFPMFVAEG